MSDKAQSYAHLAEETAESLTKSLSNWTGFLTTVGRIYKYPYHEQLMIYAQRPDATACADYELWNNKMNRYVRRGSKGIALLDDTGDRLKLKYVFDVSDTGGRGKSRYPFLWEMQEYYKDPILEMLKDRYDTEGISIADALYNIAKDLAAEYYEDHKADIEYLTEGSFLEDYDEDNIRVAFEDAATVSIAYTLIKRCGLDTEEYFDHEDFLNIFDFNTADAVAMLGTAISEQSEQVLRQIALTIAKIERERSKSHERTNLQQERGLSDTRPHTDRADGQQGTALGQIRQNEEKVPTGTQNTVIPFPAPVREVVPTSTGNRPDSQQTVRADNGRLAESADTARQEEKSDGLGGTHEQSESTGGGNDTDRAHIQLSLFPSEEEQKQRIAESKKPSAFSLPLEENEQLSFEPKQEELLADWLVRFFNSLPTKYKGTFEIGKVELKKWKHIRSKEENLMITITSTLADYGDNSFTQFNKDKTDERIIHEAIDNSYLLTQLSKDKDFSISLSPSSIYIFYHKFKHKHIDFSLAEQFDDTTQEPTASVPDHEPQADSELISDTADAEIETPAVTDPQAEIPPQAQQSEPVPIPFSKGDTVYLENGTPFIIEEITDHKVSLRDPTLFYPIWRAESRESFLRLLERYPQSEAPQEQEKAENFRIADNHLGEGSKREKFARNMAAITTLQTIEREHRTATKEEQEILSQYIGWGGLSEAFDKDNSSFSGEYTQLKALLSDEEYSMARASTLNAHYTTPMVIRAIYEAVEKMGFETGNILEPACGTGNFFGMLPDSMQGSRLYGIELDSVTGRIAKQLYPDADIAIAGFEKTDLPDNFFDLAIGNVPFGNYKLSEKRYDSNDFLIHDHF